ncbi:hypothetical protein [Streptomyces sp. B6B3]|uniref:hypothetical protein n=1 Tax=Streptomyces sp. B6B3 TaxID=3153570 RepID=UPI00325D2AB1
MTGEPEERTVDRALSRAVLQSRPYSEQELEAAESRIAARVSNRMLYRALCLDDEIRDGIGDEMRRAARRAARSAGEPERFTEAAYLAMLCRTVVERDGALQHMAAFLGRRIPQPDGARVLGCVLQLAGREDSARFWWQFAAGAGDTAAAYCLYLHHLTLGEAWEAELWRRQVDPGPPPAAVGRATGSTGNAGDTGLTGLGGPDEPWRCGAHGAQGATEDGSNPALVLRVLTGLRGDGGEYLTATATAVLHYVPGAVHFVDEIELPLPVADFAQRIEELTATV